MSGSIELWDWERAVLRQLLYIAPDGGGDFTSILDAAAMAGHSGIHPDKLRGFANKLVALGYGQAVTREIVVPSIDVDFKLSSAGYDAALNSTSELRYSGPLNRASKFNWSALAAAVSAIAAVASAVFAFQATH